MMYINQLPEDVIEIILAIQEKNLVAQGYPMDEIFEAKDNLVNSKVSDIDVSEFIEVIFQ